MLEKEGFNGEISSDLTLFRKPDGQARLTQKGFAFQYYKCQVFKLWE